MITIIRDFTIYFTRILVCFSREWKSCMRPSYNIIAPSRHLLSTYQKTESFVDDLQYPPFLSLCWFAFFRNSFFATFLCATAKLFFVTRGNEIFVFVIRDSWFFRPWTPRETPFTLPFHPLPSPFCTTQINRWWTLKQEPKEPLTSGTSIYGEYPPPPSPGIWWALKPSLTVFGSCPWGARTNTRNRRCCALPFTYKGKSYDKCIMKNHDKLWCSLDSAYNGRWANCGKERKSCSRMLFI